MCLKKANSTIAQYYHILYSEMTAQMIPYIQHALLVFKNKDH